MEPSAQQSANETKFEGFVAAVGSKELEQAYMSLAFKDMVLVTPRLHKIEGDKEVKAFHFNMIDSTMNLAEFWPKAQVTDKTSFCFIADCQKSGKGQRDNEWSSPVGNCYVTYLLKLKPEQSFYMAQLATLSVV